MRKTILALLLLVVAVPAGAQVEVTAPSWEPFIGTDPITGTTLVGNGYARYSVTTAVQLTAAPAAGAVIHRLARHAIIHVEVGDIRVRYDGTNPTAAEGELLPVGTRLTLENARAQLLALRMIATGASATVTVTYFR